jgi:hypothetical protein
MRSQYIVIGALFAGLLFSGSVSAQSRLCNAAMTSVECNAYLNQPDSGLKPPVEDMECIEFVQDKPGKVILTFWKDKKRTELVRDPIVHEKDGVKGIFRQGGSSFDRALEGWVDLCNGTNRSQRDKAFIAKARHSGQCMKMCLLGEAECKKRGYFYEF